MTKKETTTAGTKETVSKETPAKKRAATKKKEEAAKKETAAKKDGKFQKGHKKVGGRQKGTPNKLTTDFRKALQEQLGPHITAIGNTIEQIEDPAQKASALATWAQYLMPKYSNTTISTDTKRDIATEDYIKELNDNYEKAAVSIDITQIKIVDNG